MARFSLRRRSAAEAQVDGLKPQVHDRNPEGRCSGARRGGAARAEVEQLRPNVFQVEAKFALGIGAVERGIRSPSLGDAEERRQDFRTVPEGCCDALARLHRKRRHVACDFRRSPSEIAVG